MTTATAADAAPVLRLRGLSMSFGGVHALSGTTYIVVAMINATDAHRGTGEEFLDALVEWVHEF